MTDQPMQHSPSCPRRTNVTLFNFREENVTDHNSVQLNNFFNGIEISALNPKILISWFFVLNLAQHARLVVFLFNCFFLIEEGSKCHFYITVFTSYCPAGRGRTRN